MSYEIRIKDSDVSKIRNAQRGISNSGIVIS